MHSIAAVTATVSGEIAATPQPRLVRAAHEFEAQMMKELMKPMTQASSLGEFASEALGRALSERGGFGIATSIVKDLSHSGNKAVTGPVTGNLHRNTVIKASE
jgi:Rod binding domain-containing protein